MSLVPFIVSTQGLPSLVVMCPQNSMASGQTVCGGAGLLLFKLRNSQAQDCLPLDLLCEKNPPVKPALCCLQLNAFLTEVRTCSVPDSVLTTVPLPSPVIGKIHWPSPPQRSRRYSEDLDPIISVVLSVSDVSSTGTTTIVRMPTLDFRNSPGWHFSSMVHSNNCI